MKKFLLCLQELSKIMMNDYTKNIGDFMHFETINNPQIEINGSQIKMRM